MPMNILYMLGTMPGTMMSRNKMMAYVTGTMMHGMMGIVLALAHAGVIKGLDLTSALIAWGVLFGFVHYGHDWDYASIDARRPNESARTICHQFAQDDRGGVSYGSPCLRPGGSCSVRCVGLTRIYTGNPRTREYIKREYIKLGSRVHGLHSADAP